MQHSNYYNEDINYIGIHDDIQLFSDTESDKETPTTSHSICDMQPSNTTIDNASFACDRDIKIEDDDDDFVDIKPINEVKRRVRMGYRKGFRHSDSAKDRIRMERRRESNRKAAEKCRKKKMVLQNNKEKEARKSLAQVSNLNEENKQLKEENKRLSAENIDLRAKLEMFDKDTNDTNLDLDYFTLDGADLNFNSQNKLKYFQD